MRVAIQLLLFGSGTEAAEVVGSRLAYPERIVPGFAAGGSKDFADSHSFAAALVAEGPVAEYILEALVVKMGCKSSTNRLGERSVLHTRFAGFEAERVVLAADQLEYAHLAHRKGS